MVFHRGRQLFSLTEGRLQPSSFISGQAFGYSDVESTGMLEMIVVVFQPFAAKAFLHMPVSEFRGMNVNTEETGDPLLVDLGRRIADMPDRVACIRLIEEFLLSRLYAFPEYNLKRVSTVLEAVNLHPHIRTAQLADVACLSNKQFGRVFAEYVGATPKEFLRIVRIQRALYTLQCQPGISFAQLAYECGFFDQSHMIKEFKFFSGYTPAEYLAVCAPYSDYFFVEE
ncbi:bacterial regulatory helix-turn-helix s, AraC family protein [Bacteroides fragilis str. S24L15]|nr:bacterial regulatory helix-turn-helix s, AraC family protein [Bacteroides fragilis str. S24L15]EYA75036.1 bacterial regulatory helix-turn-helix s, AraC family protein [Bacteroides fragilis str. S24L26]EYA79652.1 bacterial regulatory helix-turn-helix s, AraC family protein [Bacteroides fragilis str. S24L34]EYB04136.1 bacterial regulatory helix-turn-helix s, AraC family protein [Bacteroides fragilis str. S6R5]